MNSSEMIYIGDLVSFETSDGMDIMQGHVWAIEKHQIRFFAHGNYYAVPRALAEESTQLILRYNRSEVISDILDLVVA